MSTSSSLHPLLGWPGATLHVARVQYDALRFTTKYTTPWGRENSSVTYFVINLLEITRRDLSSLSSNVKRSSPTELNKEVRVGLNDDVVYRLGGLWQHYEWRGNHPTFVLFSWIRSHTRKRRPQQQLEQLGLLNGSIRPTGWWWRQEAGSSQVNRWFPSPSLAGGGDIESLTSKSVACLLFFFLSGATQQTKPSWVAGGPLHAKLPCLFH